MINYSQKAIEQATYILELKRNNLHVAPFYFQDLAIEIYNCNEDLKIEAFGPDNKEFSTLSSQMLMLCEMGNFKYDLNKMKESLCSYAKSAIEDLFDELSEGNSVCGLEHGDYVLDRAEYERERI